METWIRWEFCSQIPECPKDNGSGTQKNVQCGLLEEHFEAKWGHNSVTAVGHPSRLNSKGDILKPRRNRRSNKRSKPVSWLDMIKNRDIYDGKLPILVIVSGLMKDKLFFQKQRKESSEANQRLKVAGHG